MGIVKFVKQWYISSLENLFPGHLINVFLCACLMVIMLYLGIILWMRRLCLLSIWSGGIAAIFLEIERLSSNKCLNNEWCGFVASVSEIRTNHIMSPQGGLNTLNKLLEGCIFPHAHSVSKYGGYFSLQ